jgi:hypothetical protein
MRLIKLWIHVLWWFSWAVKMAQLINHMHVTSYLEVNGGPGLHLTSCMSWLDPFLSHFDMFLASRADFDLQLGFNARKYFVTGYDVILMKCACLPGLWKELYQVNRVALSNLAHKHIKSKNGGLFERRDARFLFWWQNEPFTTNNNIFFCKSISNVFTSKKGGIRSNDV